MEQLRRVAEQDEGGGSHLGLGHVVDLESLALVRGRLDAHHGLTQHVVEGARGDTEVGLLVDRLDQIVQAVDALARLGGDEGDGGVGHVGQGLADAVGEGLDGGIVLLDGIPLVHHDDGSLARLVSNARDLLVLLGDAHRGIDHDEADVSPLHRHVGAEDAVLLHLIPDLGLAADACGVDEGEGAPLIDQAGVHRVTGGARDIRDDHAVLPEETVDDGGLSGVGLTDDGDLDAALLLLALLPVGESVTAGVQNVACARAVDRGHGDGVEVKAQLVELVVFVGQMTHAVALVDAGDDGLAALLEHDGDIAVGGGEARADVAHEDDGIGIVNGHLSLHLHLGQDDIVGAGLDTAGVDEDELAAVPFGLAVDAVTGDTGGVLHDGAALTDELVEQGRFTDVGTANDGDDRLGHGYGLLSGKGMGLEFVIRNS